MNRSGMGVGSASIILVFAVLCLTIFALISFTAANVDKAMLDISLKTVHEYYEADTLAECILAEILESSATPKSLRGVDIISEIRGGVEHVRFECTVSDTKNLYVEVAIYDGGAYDVLSWKVYNIGEWEADESLPVWLGD